MTKKAIEPKNHETPYYRELEKRVRTNELPIQALEEALKEGNEFEKECARSVLTCNFHGLSMVYKDETLELAVWYIKNPSPKDPEDFILLAMMARIAYGDKEFKMIQDAIEEYSSEKGKGVFKDVMKGYEEAEAFRRLTTKKASRISPKP